MTNFGKYGILGDTVYNFDQEPDWYWKIAPITSGHELEMAKFLASVKHITLPDGSRQEQFPTAMEVAMREVSLSFAGTNIPDEEGNPIIPDGASIEVVEEKLKLFPSELFMEIWTAVGQSYPRWGPVDPNLAPTS